MVGNVVSLARFIILLLLAFFGPRPRHQQFLLHFVIFERIFDQLFNLRKRLIALQKVRNFILFTFLLAYEVHVRIKGRTHQNGLPLFPLCDLISFGLSSRQKLNVQGDLYSHFWNETQVQDWLFKSFVPLFEPKFLFGRLCNMTVVFGGIRSWMAIKIRSVHLQISLWSVPHLQLQRRSLSI